MQDMFEAGLRGRLPQFIGNFMKDRQFRIRFGLSDWHTQETGGPQGCILSVTLFLLKINSIIKCLLPGVRNSLYVDDFVVCYRSTHMRAIERQLQHCLNNLHTWADENGFRFSESKTVCVHFCHRHSVHSDPELILDGKCIPVVEETKFLGLIFDKKLTFVPHIKYLKDKCMKAMNLLKVVSHTDWGADTDTLLKLYRSHIRSKLDYGCIVYGSARPSYLKALDCVQNLALRICLRAFRTSPTNSLHVESNETPLTMRRERLAIQYMLKIRATPQNPVYDYIFKPSFKKLFEKKPHAIAPLGIRLNQRICDIGISMKHIAIQRQPSIPVWCLKSGIFNFDLQILGRKSDVPPHEYISKYNEFDIVYMQSRQTNIKTQPT